MYSPNQILKNNVHLDLKLAFMLMILAAVCCWPFSHRLNRSRSIGFVDDVVFSEDSQKLLVEYRIFNETPEESKAFQIWNFEEKLGRKNPAVFPFLPTSTAWNSVCYFDGETAYLRDFTQKNRDLEIIAYELDSSASPIEHRDTEREEYLLALEKGTHRNSLSSIDMQGGKYGDLTRLRLTKYAKFDPVSFHCVFCWRDQGGEVFQLTLQHLKGNQFRLGRVGMQINKQTEFRQPEVSLIYEDPGLDIKKSSNSPIVRELSRIEIDPSSGCKFFVLTTGTSDPRKILFDQNMNKKFEFEALNWCYSANGKYLAYYDEPEHQICVVESELGKMIDTIPMSIEDSRITRIGISSDGRRIAYETNRFRLGQFVQIFDRQEKTFLVDLKTGAFPFWITTLCLFVWGLVFGKLCLKPGKVHPMGQDFMRIIMALASFAMMGSFCCIGTFLPGNDIEFLIFINVVCSVFFIPAITRKYAPPEPVSPVADAANSTAEEDTDTASSKAAREDHDGETE